MIKAELRVLTGRHAGKAISLPAKKFLIGRGEDCHLRPNSDLISRHHCVFTVDEYGVQLRDLGSTNGTFVNEEQLKGVRVLESKDQIRVGKLLFEILFHSVAQEDELGQTTLQGADETVISGMDETSHNLPDYESTISLESSTDADNWSQTDPHNTTDTHDIPADWYNQQVGQPGMGDTQADTQAFQYPPGGQPYPMQYPQGYGNYPQGVYPQMPYPQYPMQGYPQYPMQGYPQYPMPGYPPQQPASGEIQVPPQNNSSEPESSVKKKFNNPIPVKLPDPSETGVKEEVKKVEEKKATSGEMPAAEPEKPSSKAADIINQYRNRRPG